MVYCAALRRAASARVACSCSAAPPAAARRRMCARARRWSWSRWRSRHESRAAPGRGAEERSQAERRRRPASCAQRFREAGVFVVSLVSSPGAGKTALLERTLTAAAPALSGGRARRRPRDRERRRPARPQRRAGAADHHRDRLPPRGRDDPQRPSRAGTSSRSTSCSSRTSAISSARRPTTWARTSGWC